LSGARGSLQYVKVEVYLRRDVRDELFPYNTMLGVGVYLRRDVRGELFPYNTMLGVGVYLRDNA
jgi:hypothetical protein